jgi:Protein of unknown function (DUF2510)
MADEVYQAGWYPDPVGRFEYRFHNGIAWTADVSTGGVRHVDPLGLAAPQGVRTATTGGVGRTDEPRNRLATAAMVLGIISMTLAWVPFIVVIGAVCAVLAIVFGLIALRRRGGRGFAVAGLATGSLGATLCVVGVIFSIVVVREIDRFANPAAHEARLTSCVLDGSTATVAGEIENLADEPADFAVLVALVRPGTDNAHRTVRAVVDDVAPGAVATFELTRQVRLDDIACEISEVTGPLPFGLDVQT